MTPQNDSLMSIHELVKGEASMKRRMGYVALLLAAAAMTTVIVALWATEPALPLRTHIAFGAMSVIGLSWIALAGWVLTTRRVLFARDRLIAGRMAVAFTSVFVLGALAMLIATGSAAAAGALGTGVAMVLVAAAVLRQAHRRFAALSARRVELEREIGSPSV
jgi:hypothetical protein